MSNYTKSGPYVNGGPPGLQASLFNNIENTFVQPAGGTETGGYYLTGPTTTTLGVSMGAWVPTLSRGTTPVSVSINTSVLSPSSCNSPSTDHLTQYGFHVFTTSNTNVGGSMNVAGTWTMQY